MDERWFKHAVIYSLDVETFQDSNGDGVGDIPGLIARLPRSPGRDLSLAPPIHPTPDLDDGYDVSDYYGVNPRIGSLGDFVELIHRARNRGVHVMLDLVINHTSDEHPWFQSSRSSPDSAYRDWYIWSKAEPAGPFEGVVFPGSQERTWPSDDAAQAWYYHRFYDFEPDLNWANPEVRCGSRSRFHGRNGAMIAVSNLANQPSTIDLSADLGTPSSVLEMFANRRYQTRPTDLASLDLDGWGYRWLRRG